MTEADTDMVFSGGGRLVSQISPCHPSLSPVYGTIPPQNILRVKSNLLSKELLEYSLLFT